MELPFPLRHEGFRCMVCSMYVHCHLLWAADLILECRRKDNLDLISHPPDEEMRPRNTDIFTSPENSLYIQFRKICSPRQLAECQLETLYKQPST